MYILLTEKSEINAILKQEQIQYDCIGAGDNYLLYQVKYFDCLGYLVGIKKYKVLTDSWNK